MSWYKISQSDTFQDWFTEEAGKSKNRHIVSKEPPAFKTFITTLYRGFDANLDELNKENGNYILSPKKSEQGFLWFSQKLNIAKGRGEYILEYPLQVKRHYQTVHFNDGSSYEDVPEEILDQTIPTDNCRFFAGMELPEGWFFSYKTEKHIVCSVPLIIHPNMIKTDRSYKE